MLSFDCRPALAQTAPTGTPIHDTGSTLCSRSHVSGQTNPNYPIPNPFYFEGRIDWDLLKITQPSNAWEYMQRGIHEQDDLAEHWRRHRRLPAVHRDEQSREQNLPVGHRRAHHRNDSNPPPCIFTVRLRLAGLLRDSHPKQAIDAVPGGVWISIRCVWG